MPSGIPTRLQNLVEDTTPQLGGSLDVNGQEIVSAGDSDIVINPTGTNNLTIGDGGTNNYAQFAANGNLSFVGTAGLIFGEMFIPGEDIVVPISTANPYELNDGPSSFDGWSAGELNGVTFPTLGLEHYLTVPVAGKYEVSWAICGHIAAGASAEVHIGIMVDGAAIRNRGEAQRSVNNLNDNGSLAASAICDCPNGTEEISLWVAVSTSNDFHATHGTITIKLISGT